LKTDGFESLAQPRCRLLKIGSVSVSYLFFFFLRFDMHILNFCFNDKVPWVIEHKFIPCGKQARSQM